MNITIAVHPSWLDHSAELASVLSVAARLSHPRPEHPTHPIPAPREACEDPVEPEHRQPRQRAGRPAGSPTTGRALYGWIKDRSDADRVLKVAQGVAKKLGYSWKLATLSDDAAQAVFHDLVNKALPAINGGAHR
jgi:hypothetical protein